MRIRIMAIPIILCCFLCTQGWALPIMRNASGPLTVVMQIRPLSVPQTWLTPNNIKQLRAVTGAYVVLVCNRADNIVQAQGFDKYGEAEDYYLAQVLKGNGQKLLKMKAGKRHLRKGVVVAATASVIQ